ncbi:MAG: hypothetical protein K6E47_00620 [Lachnospiraceae bacterium]|nr:hypothetical protein [Lachnospiraceae bacterium]
MSVLAKLLKNNRICVTVAVIIAIIANLSQMIYIVYIGELVNRIENREKVTSTLVTILACFLISNVVTVYLKHYSGRYAAEKMAHSLRMGFIGKLLERKSGYRSSEGESVDKKVRYLDKSVKTDAGAVMSKVQNELSRADEYLSNTFFDITDMLLTCVLVFVFLMFQNVLLTLVIFTPTLLILLYVKWSSRKLSGIVSSALKEKEKMNSVSYSLVHAFPAVKIYNGDDMCVGLYEKSLENWGKHEADMEKLNALYNSLSGILSRVPMLLLITVGGFMVIKGNIMLGTLIVFLNMQSSLTNSIMNLPSWISGFKVFTTNLDKIDEV